MIYDCFTFFNELDLLEVRLAELSGTVDRFVLVEASRTHRGDPKPLSFAENRGRFAEHLERIVHVVVEDLPVSDDPWEAENFQRNAIQRGLTDAADSDLAVVSDVDEIPAPAVLRHLHAEGQGVDGQVIGLHMRMFYYSLNWEYETYWDRARVVTVGTLRTLGAQAVRDAVPTRVVPGGGWHFSYLARGPERLERLQTKARSFAHAEYATPAYLDPRYVDYCLTHGFRWCDDRPFDTRFRYHRIDSGYPVVLQGDSGRYAELCSAAPPLHSRARASLRHTPAVLRRLRGRIRSRFARALRASAGPLRRRQVGA